MTRVSQTTLIERAPWPDALLRLGIAARVGRTRRLLANADAGAAAAFAAAAEALPIAVHADAANAQHYELPAGFFSLVLGPQRKYSCCLYELAGTTLAGAEDAALAATAARADLRDGQTVLELGCGWGSLSLWMARHYPASRIVAVSNARPQRAFIEQRARAEGLGNLTVVTADMNDFAPVGPFTRIVSIEMFEHMSNWRALFGRIRNWLAADGRLFLHVFSHRSAPYRFDHSDRADWIAQHFFTGGIMPSHDYIRQVADGFAIEQDWRWSGTHYARTARDWLANFDRNRAPIRDIFDSVYGRDAALWLRRWRLFFLATEGLFGHAGGEVWGVSHYRLRPL